MSADTQRNQELAFIGQQLARIADALEASVPAPTAPPAPPQPDPEPAPSGPMALSDYLKLSDAEKVALPLDLTPHAYQALASRRAASITPLMDELGSGAQ